jgi:hypothetical protein
MYTVGRIVHFAATHGYYKINHGYHLLPEAAHVIYAGALLYIITMPFNLLPLILWFPVWVRVRRLRSTEMDENAEKTQIIGGYSSTFQNFVWISAGTTWLASWLIWSGYVLLMGDL